MRPGNFFARTDVVVDEMAAKGKKLKLITSEVDPDLGEVKRFMKEKLAEKAFAVLIAAILALLTSMRDLNTELRRRLEASRRKRPPSETLRRLQMELPFWGTADNDNEEALLLSVAGQKLLMAVPMASCDEGTTLTTQALDARGRPASRLPARLLRSERYRNQHAAARHSAFRKLHAVGLQAGQISVELGTRFALRSTWSRTNPPNSFPRTCSRALARTTVATEASGWARVHDTAT